MLAGIISALKTQPASPHRIADPIEMKKKYHYWRVRTMYAMMVGYALFYFCRKNFSMAMPSFTSELGFTKTDLGWVLSGFSIVYGLAKFVNGALADRANPRYFMAAGLLFSAIVNIVFGMSSAFYVFAIFWLLNAWFQGMGWPPCARLLTHWYSPTELGTKWGIWNASHQFGGAGIYILAGYLIEHYGWRSAFTVPAILAIFGAIFLMNRLRDTPQSLGLPSVEYYKGDLTYDSTVEEEREAKLPFKEILFKHVLTNKYVWIVCFANFFVYIVRMGVMDWAPTFLTEVKQSSLTGAGFSVAGFEIAGIVGALLAGWMSDKVFKGRRGPVNVIFMLAVVFILIEFWLIPPGHPLLDGAAIFAVGFLIYGPQMLVGVAAADFSTKQAASTATGLTGTFGYFGSAVAGVGTGWLVDNYGWDGGFMFFIASGVIGTLLFMTTWKHRSTVLEKHHAKK